MPTPRQGDDSRANQKARTRAAIVEGAKRLQEQGETPTVAGAAEEAGVSRATAYRYFPTQESLLVELEITPTVAATEQALTRLDTDDVEERVRFLQDSLNPVALADEAIYRRALWVYQDTWLRSHRDGDPSPAVREGRRMRWLDHALHPLDELPPELDRRLKAALALTLSGDSIVIMKDVCRLDGEEALDVLRWAATVILHAGLEELRASRSSARD